MRCKAISSNMQVMLNCFVERETWLWSKAKKPPFWGGSSHQYVVLCCPSDLQWLMIKIKETIETKCP
jgi:hypothetical protein